MILQNNLHFLATKRNNDDIRISLLQKLAFLME